MKEIQEHVILPAQIIIPPRAKSMRDGGLGWECKKKKRLPDYHIQQGIQELTRQGNPEQLRPNNARSCPIP
ncbi:MAG: hypothetical protein J6A62_07300 [Oscillospiraceae bacterium]|nr:hypothetical protein [Oscillospiraceae bacterium]